MSLFNELRAVPRHVAKEDLSATLEDLPRDI